MLRSPYFIIDPIDGSLYIFTNRRDGLKKYPYSIAELVSASPSKTSDGYLFTGDKKDQWLAIDYRNGHKLDTLTAETLSTKISLPDENVIYIGRTQYVISMFDVNTRKKIFNLTYYDYSTQAIQASVDTSVAQPKQPATSSSSSSSGSSNHRHYPFYHFTSSSDGSVVCVDKRSGELQWKLTLESPVVAMYRYDSEQLYKINFVVFSAETLNNLEDNSHAGSYELFVSELPIGELELANSNFGNDAIVAAARRQQKQKQQQQRRQGDKDSFHFLSTLYVGFYKNNLYALPSIIFDHSDRLALPGAGSLAAYKEIGFEIRDDDDEADHNRSDDDDEEQITGEADDVGGSGGGESSPFGSKSSNPLDNKTVFIGHHKLPERFKPPPNYIQSNKNLFVMALNDEKNYATLEDILHGNPLPLCPIPDKIAAPTRRDSIVDTLVRFVANVNVLTTFAVCSVCTFVIFYFDRQRRVRQ